MSRRRIPFEIDDPSDQVNSKLKKKQQDRLVETPQDSEETEKQNVLTVSQLTRKIRLSLENKFRGLTVEGELSNFHRAPSGHWYFTLKDEESQIRGVMFRPSTSSVRFRPEDGSLLKSVEDVETGEAVEIRLEDGELKTKVLEKKRNPEKLGK